MSIQDINNMKIKYALKKYIEGILRSAGELQDNEFVEIELLEIDSDKKNGSFSFSVYTYPRFEDKLDEDQP